MRAASSLAAPETLHSPCAPTPTRRDNWPALPAAALPCLAFIRRASKPGPPRATVPPAKSSSPLLSQGCRSWATSPCRKSIHQATHRRRQVAAALARPAREMPAPAGGDRSRHWRVGANNALGRLIRYLHTCAKYLINYAQHRALGLSFTSAGAETVVYYVIWPTHEAQRAHAVDSRWSKFVAAGAMRSS